jgi:hypothetical protein
MASENGLLSLLCNLILPIFILNRLSLKLGPTLAVVLALLFPLFYGSYYLIKNRKVNPISILGLLNVAVTGGFALSGLTGMWFAVKEAAFPALIGVFVLGSSWTKRPFMSMLLLNPQIMQTEKLEQSLRERAAEHEFYQLLQLGTRWLSASFFLSSLVNFILAVRIFSDIDATLQEAQRSVVLNEQIAQMTWSSALVIVLPSMIFMTLLMLYLLKRLEKITGESWQNFMKA